MEIKKTSEADLEQYRSMWLLLGCVVALSVLFVALEWSVRTDDADWQDLLPELVFEEELEVPMIEQPEVIPPPPPVVPAVTPEVVTVVEDDVQVEDEPVEIQEQVGGASADDVQPVEAEESLSTEKGDFVLVDELPEFPDGGQAGLMRYLTQHIRYPLFAQHRNLQGNVVCQFMVNEDGSISDVRVLQGVHPVLDNEAVRVLRFMPRWKPGRLHGKPVRVCYSLPVVFRLQ